MPTVEPHDPLAPPVPAPVAAPGPDLSVLEAVAVELDEVEAALARLDDGTYGVCTACGASLPDDVLAADPLARHCPAHAGPAAAPSAPPAAPPAAP